MSKVKQVSSYDGIQWVGPYDIGADAVNVDIEQSDNTLIPLATVIGTPQVGESKSILERIGDAEEKFLPIATERSVSVVSLLAENWEDTMVNGESIGAPYTQTVTVVGITADDTPIISPKVTELMTPAEEKTTKKEFGYISYGFTSEDSITFVCKSRKPEHDFDVNVKGV